MEQPRRRLMGLDAQSDRVLDFLASQKESWSDEELSNRISALELADIKMALQRLLRDKYIEPVRVFTSHGQTVHYRITLDGAEFHQTGGYKVQTEIARELAAGSLEYADLSDDDKLNAMLRGYVDHGLGHPALAADLATTLRPPIPGTEGLMLARHLEGAGHLEWIPLRKRDPRTGVEEPILEKICFTATVPGRAFLRNGGYGSAANQTAVPLTIGSVTNNTFNAPAIQDNSHGRSGDNDLEATKNPAFSPSRNPIKKKPVSIRVLAWCLTHFWALLIGSIVLLAGAVASKYVDVNWDGKTFNFGADTNSDATEPSELDGDAAPPLVE